MARKSSESGQIVLIVLLVVVFAVAVGLSLIGRTTENVSISSQLDESGMALSAAEAGITQAIMSVSGSVEPGPVSPGSNQYYDVKKSEIGNVQTYKLPEKTPNGQLAIVWLNTHNTDGTLSEDKSTEYGGGSLDVCWSLDENPAIVTSLFFKRGSTYLVGKGAYGKVIGRDDRFDNVDNPDGSGTNCGVSGVYRKRITFSDLGFTATDVLLALRMRPLYAVGGAQFYLQAPPGSLVPLQGNRYVSTGTVKESGTENATTRVVQVDRVYSAPSSLFDYVIYSQNNFSQ